MFQKLIVTLALVGLTSTVAVLTAEDADKGSASQSTARSSTDSSPDHMFASCVAVANQEEIILGEFGQKKAHSDAVKKFAETMVADHHAFLLKLKKFAPEATQPGFLDTGVKEAKSEDKGLKVVKAVSKILQTAATDDADKKGVETAGAESTHKGIDFLQMQREMANECLALTREKLAAKSGAEFDECFMGQQVGMHLGMKAKLTVLKRHASSELAEVLAEGLKSTDQHLAKAEHVLKTISHHADRAEKREVRKERRDGAKEEVKEEKESKPDDKDKE